MTSDTQLFGESGSSKNFQNNSLTSVIDSYTRYYATGSSHTARAKRLDLDHFLDFLCSLRGISKPEKLKVRDWDFSAVQRFVEESLNKGEAPATVARRLATIKHMGRTLSEKIRGFINPAREVKPPKVQTLRPKAISDKEIGKIRKIAFGREKQRMSFNRLRNRTLFNFLIDTGLRADEVRLLKLGQLDDKLEWISSVRTKGRRYRNVYITSEMRADLGLYLEARTDHLKKYYSKISKSQDRALPLFISTYDAVPSKPETFFMGAKTIWRAIHELSADTELHPHLLRHSYALDLLNTSNDVRLVAQALGHSDVRITMRYTERMDQEVAQALERSRKKSKKAA